MAIAVAEKRKQPTKKRDDYEAPSRNGRIHHSRRLPGNNNVKKGVYSGKTCYPEFRSGLSVYKQWVHEFPQREPDPSKHGW